MVLITKVSNFILERAVALFIHRQKYEKIAYLTLEKIEFAYLTPKNKILPIYSELEFSLPI